jgi:hypothetical protein
VLWRRSRGIVSLTLEVTVNRVAVNANDVAVAEATPVLPGEAATDAYCIRTRRFCQNCNEEEPPKMTSGTGSGEFEVVRGEEVVIIQGSSPFRP